MDGSKEKDRNRRRAACAAGRTFFAIVALLAIAPAAGAAKDDVETRRITVDGIAREYVFLRADGDGPHPAVLMLHGGGGSARQLRRHSGFDAQARAHGLVAIYAEGIAHGWEVPGPPRDTRRSQEGDLAFLLAVVDQLAKEGFVDANQVFAAGISNGGRMALALACTNAERLRGIAVVAASLPEGAPCRAARPLAVLLIQGADDTITPLEGGEVAIGRIRRGRLLGLEKTLVYWATVNGCADAATEPMALRDADDPTRAERRVYAGCRAPLEAIVIAGGGHTWPGAPVLPLLARLVGPTSRQVDASAEIASFFARRGAQR